MTYPRIMLTVDTRDETSARAEVARICDRAGLEVADVYAVTDVGRDRGGYRVEFKPAISNSRLRSHWQYHSGTRRLERAL